MNTNNDTYEIDFKTPCHYEYFKGTLFKMRPEQEAIRVMDGQVDVLAQVLTDNDRVQNLLRIRDCTGKEHQKLIPSSALTGTACAQFLHELGLVIHAQKELRPFILSLMGQIAGQPRLTALKQVGWLADYQGFFTGKQLMLHPNIEDHYHPIEIPDAQRYMRKEGTLAEWRANIGVHLEANDVTLVFGSLSLASVLLGAANMTSGIFNLYGLKGTGKTLCLQMAASIWGNGSDPAHTLGNIAPYIRKVNSTANGLEALLSTYGVLPAILDELGEMVIRDLNTLCYSLASGHGKWRMTSDRQLAKANSWMLNILMSSEVAIGQLIQESGQKLMGGQADRAADIPLPKSGLFNDLGDFESFQAFAMHLKTVTPRYYGSAGHAFVKYCVDNPDAVREEIGLIPEYVRELAPKGCDDGELRVVRRFALSFVACAIAWEAGIFTGDLAEHWGRHERLVQSWWRHRSFGMEAIAHVLGQHLNRIRCEAPTVSSPLASIFYHGDLFTFESSFFESVVPDHEAVLHNLESFGMLKREQANRRKHRYCSGRFFGYSIHADRLLEHMDWSPEDVTRLSAMHTKHTLIEEEA